MSIDKNQGRRASISVEINGASIDEDLKKYFLSLDYTDNQEDETDDLQIRLQDRDGVWTNQWLTDMVEATGLSIAATITRHNWTGPGQEDSLPCGEFQLDSVDLSGPPAVLTLKGTSLAYAPIRQTLRSQAWESYTLSGIASEMAGRAGLGCQYLSSVNPFYARIEQDQTSDIDFLSDLCHRAGLSLKCTDGKLVVFNQKDQEAEAPVFTFRSGDGSYTKYKLTVGTADTHYARCRVSYVDPDGVVIEGMAYDSQYEDEQQLEVTAKVSSVGEAQAMAESLLRLHNKYATTITITCPGNPVLLAGCNIKLEGFGGYDGKYSITSARHSVVESGYTCSVSGRLILEGY